MVSARTGLGALSRRATNIGGGGMYADQETGPLNANLGMTSNALGFGVSGA